MNRKQKLIIFLLSLITVTLTYFVCTFTEQDEKQFTPINSPKESSEPPKEQITIKKPESSIPPSKKELKTFEKNLLADINTYLETVGHFSSLYFIDMTTGFETALQSDKLMLAASCTKLPWIMKLASLVDQKKIDPNKKIAYEKKYFRPGSGIIQFSDYGREYTLTELLHELTDESDNIAFAMIYEQVAFTFPDPDFLSEIAPPSHKPMNRISSKQLAYYLKYIVEHLEEPGMAHLFKKLTTTNSDDEAGTNLAITDGRKVANKVGWMPFALSDNDVAYIYGKSHPYIISIMTEGYTPEVSRKVIEELTHIVDKHQLKLHQKKSDSD